MRKDFEAGKNSALRLLKFRMRSKYELQNRLKIKHFSQEIVKQVLDFLSDLGYVDDLTFANAWVKSRMQFKPRSRKLLVYELKKKGIDSNIIERSLTQLTSENEEQMARQLALKRFPKLKGLPEETWKRRLSGYLARRGFSTGILFKILKELEEL